MSIFEGQLSRTWNYTKEGSKRNHVITLYHDTVTGVRSAMLDFEEITNTFGNSSLLMTQQGHRLYFVVEDLGGFIEIKRSGFTGFTYRCAVNNNFLTEVTQVVAANQNDIYKVSMTDTMATYDEENPTIQIIWYVVKAIRIEDGITTNVHRRFREFAELNSQVKQNFKGHHLRSSLPSLPSKSIKLTTDHQDPTFISQRANELDVFLKSLIAIPHVSNMNCVKAFLGIINNVREFSIEFRLATLGLSLNPSEKVRSTPALVGNVLNIDQCPGVCVGDAISKINGVPISGNTFKGIVSKIKMSPRPLLIHFIQIIASKGSATSANTSSKVDTNSIESRSSPSSLPPSSTSSSSSLPPSPLPSYAKVNINQDPLIVEDIQSVFNIPSSHSDVAASSSYGDIDDSAVEEIEEEGSWNL